MKQISGIYIYPVKSLGVISLEKATVSLHGLAFDRQWMVVDMKGMFLSQRKVPRMALIVPQIQGDDLVLTHRDNSRDAVKTPFTGPEGEARVTVQVWNDRVEAIPCRKAINEWLSDHLGTYCQLVYLPDENARPLSEKYGKAGEATLFSDSCPLLIVGEASLQDLNSHLADPVPMSRFRPNLVFREGGAFEEDDWTNFRIGEVVFRGIRKCTRCKMVNTDQVTAQVYQEPLATLAQYRRDAQGIYFGLHASRALGQPDATIRLGDVLKVH